MLTSEGICTSDAKGTGGSLNHSCFEFSLAVNCASGPWGCIVSAVLVVKDNCTSRILKGDFGRPRGLDTSDNRDCERDSDRVLDENGDGLLL